MPALDVLLYPSIKRGRSLHLRTTRRSPSNTKLFASPFTGNSSKLLSQGEYMMTSGEMPSSCIPPQYIRWIVWPKANCFAYCPVCFVMKTGTPHPAAMAGPKEENLRTHEGVGSDLFCKTVGGPKGARATETQQLGGVFNKGEPGIEQRIISDTCWPICRRPPSTNEQPTRTTLFSRL